jgi:hypothetical protein
MEIGITFCEKLTLLLALKEKSNNYLGIQC